MAGALDIKELDGRAADRQCDHIGTYTHSQGLTDFRCHICGDHFRQSFNKLGRRKPGEPGCPKCFSDYGKETRTVRRTNDMRAYAAERGGELLTESIKNSKDRATFRCAVGHEWSAVAEAIKNQKTWCPDCAGQTLRTLEQLQSIAESRGGKVLSTAYVNVDAKYDFECVLGHRFSNSFKKVEAGQWCPTCNKGRISEEVARTTFEQLFDAPFPKQRPQWLRNSRSRLMEIDGANLKLGIGFEYHGAQHFQKNLYISDDHKLRQRQDDDATKERLCREHGIALVVLTFEMTYREFPQRIVEQLTAANVDLSRVDVTKPIDLSRAYVRTDRLEELRALMDTKQIDVLSNAWLGTAQPYEMRCRVCGHEWSAVGNSYFNNRRVAGCNRCNRRMSGESLKLGLAPLIDYAAANGGELLSDTYVRRNHYYRWRCGQGHEFNGNYNNMAHRGQFCPICEGRMKRERKTT